MASCTRSQSAPHTSSCLRPRSFQHARESTVHERPTPRHRSHGESLAVSQAELVRTAPPRCWCPTGARTPSRSRHPRHAQKGAPCTCTLPRERARTRGDERGSSLGHNARTRAPCTHAPSTLSCPPKRHAPPSRAIPPTTRRARVTRATRTARARVARRSHTSHPSDHTIARPPPPYDSQTAASIR